VVLIVNVFCKESATKTAINLAVSKKNENRRVLIEGYNFIL